MATQDFDVLIVGAGVSGIGIAYYLQQELPGKTYAILEGRDSLGGTWDLFRYPGVRSDSDKYTLGFSFKPWPGRKSIVEGQTILDYVQEVADENAITDHILFGQHVTRATWLDETARWMIETTDKRTGTRQLFTAKFVAMCTGYYSYENGYAPEFQGQSDFAGDLVHPQSWPRELDYAGKSVTVIGSGATAMTLVPNMAKTAKSVTMLQRSPTYVVSRPAVDKLANVLMAVLPQKLAYPLIRQKNLLMQQYVFNKSKKDPDNTRKRLLKMARKSLSAEVVDKHFTPDYAPWDQRLCLIPDDNLFDSINSGKVSVVTDHIDHFDTDGIRLKSGGHIQSDVIVTATGLDMLHLGNIRFEVNEQPVDMADRLTYKGLGYEGVPNLVSSFGYFNVSWTMKLDLTAAYICRFLEHMDKTNTQIGVPIVSADQANMERKPWIDGMSSGYVARGNTLFPKQTGQGPWIHSQDIDFDRKLILEEPVDDGVMQFFRRDQTSPNVRILPISNNDESSPPPIAKGNAR